MLMNLYPAVTITADQIIVAACVDGALARNARIEAALRMNALTDANLVRPASIRGTLFGDPEMQSPTEPTSRIDGPLHGTPATGGSILPQPHATTGPLHGQPNANGNVATDATLTGATGNARTSGSVFDARMTGKITARCD